jgi:hypothetical protein
MHVFVDLSRIEIDTTVVDVARVTWNLASQHGPHDVPVRAASATADVMREPS